MRFARTEGRSSRDAMREKHEKKKKGERKNGYGNSGKNFPQILFGQGKRKPHHFSQKERSPNGSLQSTARLELVET